MKKLLLGTSMLAAVAMATSAQADTPKITVGGVIDWQVGFISDDKDAAQRSHGFRNDTEINFNVDGKADNGLGYGAVIVLEADVTNDADNEGTNAAETYVYLDGSWGRVEMGSTTSAADNMSVGAENIARATGGIDGDWYYFANNSIGGVGTATQGGGTGLNYIGTPGTPMENGIHATGYDNEAQQNLNKISYYTPNWNGFQAGISYAPDDVNSGQGSILGGINKSDARGVVNNYGGAATAGTTGTLTRSEHLWFGGISYEGSWDQVGVSLAVAGERGSAETAAYEDLQAWNAGAKFTYMGFSLAGSYGDWGDSLTLSTDNVDSDYYTLGAAYEFGPYGISVTWLDSDIDATGTALDLEFQNLSIGADYQLAPGLTPYAEVSFYEADAAGPATGNDNDGHVFLLGTQLNF